MQLVVPLCYYLEKENYVNVEINISNGHKNLGHLGFSSPLSCDVRISIVMMKSLQAAEPGDSHICSGFINKKV